MKPRLTIVLLAAAILPAIVVAVTVGPADIPVRLAWSTIRSGVLGSDWILSGLPCPTGSTTSDVVLCLRLPRILAALVVGAGLSVVGVAMQALVRNPLAEPYILGISGGAAAGAALFSMGLVPAYLAAGLSMSLAAFIGALASISLVYLVARSGRNLSVSRLLLAGVAMSSLMGAIASFVVLTSPDPDRMRAVLFWLMGSMSGIMWEDLTIVFVVVLSGSAILFGISRFLDAFLIGEEPAHSLGVRVEVIKRLLIVLAALMTGTMVALSGAIGFVGLIVPHMVRSMVGVSHRYVIPTAILLGALFLLGADLLAQILYPGEELPIGIVTAITGVPFFLVILRRSGYEFR